MAKRKLETRTTNWSGRIDEDCTFAVKIKAPAGYPMDTISERVEAFARSLEATLVELAVESGPSQYGFDGSRTPHRFSPGSSSGD